MIKKLLLILFLSSCVGSNFNQIKNLNSVPEFYLKPKQNDLLYLYGVGSGYNLNAAIKSALSNISSKLITNISGDSGILAKSYNGNVSEQYRERVVEKLENITFNNYQISNSAKFNNQIYAEIAIDRKSFIKQNSQKLKNLNQRFKNLSNNLEQKNIIDQYRNLIKIQNKLNEAKVLNIILDSLGYKEFNYKKNFDDYAFYQISFDNLIEKLLFIIDQKADKAIARIIKKRFSEKKIKLTNQDSKSKNLIHLRIEKEEVADKIYGSFIVKLRVNFSLLNRGKILASNMIETSGSSVIGKSEARNSAILEIYQKIKEESVEKILGL